MSTPSGYPPGMTPPGAGLTVVGPASGRRRDLADGQLDVQVTEVEGRVTLEKLPEALTVYRPIAGH
ncbi:hypothetical protein GCM10010103_04060 [Streptomyces paradoxus]